MPISIPYLLGANKNTNAYVKMQNLWRNFSGLYVPEGSTDDSKTNATNSDTTHICSRIHSNEYATVDYMDWS
jgi:hypothetical protein